MAQGPVADLAKAGFTAMTIATDYGNQGRSYLEAALVIEEIARACWSAMRACLPSETAPRRIFLRYSPCGFSGKSYRNAETVPCKSPALS